MRRSNILWCFRVLAGLLVLMAAGALTGMGTARSSGAAASAAYYYQYAPEFLVGDEAIEPAVDETMAGRAEVFRYVAAKTGTVSEIRVYLDASSSATKIVLGVYANSGSNASALLTQGSKTGVVNGAWNTVAVPAAHVTMGTTYWLAVMSPFGDAPIAIRDHCCGFGTPASSPSETSSRSDLTVLPATWRRGTRFPKDGPASLAAYGN
jgi:hypothetical protein